MTGHHVHIVLNHFPVVGINFGILCLVLAMIVRSADLRRLALGIFVLIALLAIPVYLTGESAEHTVEELADASHEHIERHEGLAKVSLGAALVLGIIAAVGIIGERRRGVMPRGLPAALLLVSLAASGTLAWTANVGGKIRRPEIRYEGDDLKNVPVAGRVADEHDEAPRGGPRRP